MIHVGSIYPFDIALNARVSILEDKYVDSRRFITIAGPGTSGTLTPPSNSTILLNTFGGTTDAIVAGLTDGKPDYTITVVEADGDPVAATIDLDGNWSLVGTPSAFPITLVYAVTQKLKDYSSDADVVGTPSLRAVTGPLSSVNEQIALFNGASGYAIKACTFNGIPKLANGVIGSATLDDVTSGATNVHLTTTLKTNYDAAYTHTSNTSNPHTVTKAQVGLGSVENTALSSWVGTANITTVGTIGTGTWNATAIADGKIAAALTGKTYNALTLTAAATGFTIAGGTTSKTLTLSGDATINQSVATTSAPAFAGLTVDTDTIYIDATNHRLGINKTNPRGDLDVSGAVYLGVAGSVNGIVNVRDSLALNFDCDGAQADAVFLIGRNRTSATGGTTFVVIKTDGKTGLGVDTPLTNIHAHSGTVQRGFILSNAITTQANSAIQLDFVHSNTGGLGVGNATSTRIEAIKTGSYTEGNAASVVAALAFSTVSNNTLAERARLDVNGFTVSNLAGTGNRAVYSDANGVLTNSSSDESLKTNIQTVTGALEKVNQLRGVFYNWKDTKKRGSQRELGMIAQEVKPFVPEIIGTNNDGTLSLDYPKLVALLVEAVKEICEKGAF